MNTNNAIKLLNEKKMVFFTGGAGSGKSYLLKELAESNSNVIVLAPTGVSTQLLNESSNIHASTIHSFLGLPLHRSEAEYITVSGSSKRRIIQGQILLLDEVSMTDAHRFDTIERLFREIRGINLPFGGILVGLFGDLAQLPPVISNYANGNSISEEELLKKLGYPKNSVDNAKIWKHFFQVELKGSYRQQGDNSFYQTLNYMRLNLLGIDLCTRDKKLYAKYLAWLNKKCVEQELPKGFTTLATTNSVVRQINDTKLANLAGKEITYCATIEGVWRDEISSAPRELTLKVGAQVICIMNDLEKRFVNGSSGIITEIKDDCIVVLIKGTEVEITPARWDNWSYTWDTDSGTFSVKSIGCLIQLPVALGFAVTVHRAQGLTIDSVYVHNEKMFNPHIIYVAASRVRNSDYLSLSKPI